MNSIGTNQQNIGIARHFWFHNHIFQMPNSNSKPYILLSLPTPAISHSCNRRFDRRTQPLPVSISLLITMLPFMWNALAEMNELSPFRVERSRFWWKFENGGWKIISSSTIKDFRVLARLEQLTRLEIE